MKHWVVILVSGLLVTVFGYPLEYKDLLYDDEYDEDPKARSYSDVPDVEETNTNYDINDAPNLFEKFVRDYNKTYKTEEDYKVHYANFIKNLEEIIANNKDGRGSYSEINMYADYSNDELSKLSG